MSGGTGTGTAKGYKAATPEQIQHLLKTHLRIYIDQATGEVLLTYGITCQDDDCPNPGKPVTYRSCPTAPCSP